MATRSLAGIAGVLACLALAFGFGWLAAVLARTSDLPLPERREASVKATAVSTLEGTVKTRRRGRVRAARLGEGDFVVAGDPLIEFDDLPLFESRSELELEVAELQASAGAGRRSTRPPLGARGQQIRLATLQHLEESYEISREEFERIRTLYNEGLLARLEFHREEREFEAVRQRLEEARATAREGPQEVPEPVNARDSLRLQRSERLLERLNRLPDTFVVRSPWDGVVRKIHVQAGDTPGLGTPLVTLSRASLLRLEADVESNVTVAAVRSACGVPGPIAFTLRDRVLSMASPSPRIRLGEECSVIVLVREPPE